MSVMEIQEGVIHEIRKTKHERVSEVAEMGSILHFLGEDIGGVDFPRNMDDIQSLSCTHSRMEFSWSLM